MASSSVDSRSTLRRSASYVFLILVGVTMILPLLWMLLTSLQPSNADVMNFSHPFPKEGLQWSNYRKVFEDTGVGRSLLNSFLVTVAVTAGLVFTSSLAAFAFARLRFFARDQIFLGYLATMMIPGMVTMIPVFLILRELRWINTYWALIIPPMFSAYGVFLLRQFFLTLPRELEEAAVIDGCTTFGVYWRIVMPLSTPALAALSILTFVGTWRSFMWPLIVTHTKDMYTLPLALTQFQEMYAVHWTMLMAGSVIMIVPMLVIFILGQRFFVAGIQLGAVKG